MNGMIEEDYNKIHEELSDSLRAVLDIDKSVDIKSYIGICDNEYLFTFIYGNVLIEYRSIYGRLNFNILKNVLSKLIAKGSSFAHNLDNLEHITKEHDYGNYDAYTLLLDNTTPLNNENYLVDANNYSLSNYSENKGPYITNIWRAINTYLKDSTDMTLEDMYLKSLHITFWLATYDCYTKSYIEYGTEECFDIIIAALNNDTDMLLYDVFVNSKDIKELYENDAVFVKPEEGKFITSSNTYPSNIDELKTVTLPKNSDIVHDFEVDFGPGVLLKGTGPERVYNDYDDIFDLPNDIRKLMFKVANGITSIPSNETYFKSVDDVVSIEKDLHILSIVKEGMGKLSNEVLDNYATYCGKLLVDTFRVSFNSAGTFNSKNAVNVIDMFYGEIFDFGFRVANNKYTSGRGTYIPGINTYYSFFDDIVHEGVILNIVDNTKFTSVVDLITFHKVSNLIELDKLARDNNDGKIPEAIIKKRNNELSKLLKDIHSLEILSTDCIISEANIHIIYFMVIGSIIKLWAMDKTFPYRLIDAIEYELSYGEY